MKYNLSDEDKAIALQTGVALSTVYQRLRTGWEKDKALNTPPQNHQKNRKRGEDGRIIPTFEGGKMRGFQLPKEYDDKMDSIIDESGLSAAAYIRDVMIRHLNRKK